MLAQEKHIFTNLSYNSWTEFTSELYKLQQLTKISYAGLFLFFTNTTTKKLLRIYAEVKSSPKYMLEENVNIKGVSIQWKVILEPSK